MGIYFHPSNFKQYVQTVYECQCINMIGEANPECYECKGTGFFVSKGIEGEYHGSREIAFEILGGSPETDYCGSKTLEEIPALLKKATEMKYKMIEKYPWESRCSLAEHAIDSIGKMEDTLRYCLYHKCSLTWG